MKERILIEGAMAERALTRLAKNGVRVERVKRVSLQETECLINGRDFPFVQQLFGNGRGAYRVKRLGAWSRFFPVVSLLKRTGLVLGGLLFLLLSLCSEAFVFKIEIQTDTPQNAEILQILKENGVETFRLYREEKKEQVCAQIFALGGVSFCSLKKSGSVLIVEVRSSSFSSVSPRENALLAERSGKVLSLCVLRGVATVGVGDEVTEGQPLARGASADDFTVARATLACVYEEKMENLDEKTAFAKALLAVYAEGVRITDKQIRKEEDGVFVRVEYEYAFSINYTE